MSSWLDLSNPLILSSCPFEINERISLFGAVTTKTVTEYPIIGDCLFNSIGDGGYINRWGLQNNGIDDFLFKDFNTVKTYNDKIIISVLAWYKDQCLRILDKINKIDKDKIVAVELNVSCPNTKSIEDIGWIKEVKNYTDFPVTVKFGVEHSVETVASFSDFIDGITILNTIPGAAKVYDKLIYGGISGRLLKPITMRYLSKLVLDYKIDIPVIAVGGVTSYKDVVDYIDCGASAVGIASVFLNNPGIIESILIDYFSYRDDTL